MKIDFRPETEEKLKQVAAEDGHATAEQLVRDVVEGYLDELAEVRDMLARRYGEVKSGAVKPIPGDQVEEFFRQKSAAARRRQSHE